MGARFEHFKTVCKHRHYVFKECRACGIAWRGLIHDLSKFSPIEFNRSARYFQGNRSPIEAEKEYNGYSLAWLHHKGCNKHHWEFWTDFDDNGGIIANEIPYKYVVEMICDWIGAGKAYEKEKWVQDSPLKYFDEHRKGRYFNERTERLIRIFLVSIKTKGLDDFHRKARNKVLKEQYENGELYSAKVVDGVAKPPVLTRVENKVKHKLHE